MDWFFEHAKIWLGGEDFAQALIVRDGVVTGAGTHSSLAPLAEGCRRVNCGGRTIVPGFLDACVCPEAAFPDLPGGRAKLKTGLEDWSARNPKTAARGAALYWHSMGETPGSAELEALPGHSPLMLIDLSRDCAWLSLRAGELAGSGQSCLHGADWRRAIRRLPAPCAREYRREMQAKLLQFAAAGVTAVQSLQTALFPNRSALSALESLYGEESALPRLRLLQPPEGLRLHPDSPGRLRPGGRLIPAEQAAFPLSSGGQLLIPAEDERALRAVLRRTADMPAAPLRRLCILGGERAETAEIRLLGQRQSGVIAFPLQREGRPCLRSAYRTLSHLGAHVAFGGLDRCAPFAAVQAAVCREDGEALTVREALSALTAESAWTMFCEDSAGALYPGFRADLLVLNRDPFTVPSDTLAQLHPVCTLCGGQLLFHAGHDY